MLDIGLVRGLIALVTLSTFLGICWWAYRPGNRDRFEADSWLAFGDDEIQRLSDGASKGKTDPSSDPDEEDRA